MNATNENPYEINAPNGALVRIPNTVNDENDIYRHLNSDASIKAYYDEHGYVVFRDLIPSNLCATSLNAFQKDVKNYAGYIYRQATANPERHRFTQRGHMENSILNIQDLSSRHFHEFKKIGLDIITHNKIQEAAAILLDDAPKLVQSMFFEGNAATWPHQDTYYLDAERIGQMTAAWIAVEDIAPGAGRFFVYPGSHKIDMQKNGGDFDIAFNHERYKQLVIDIINDHELSLHAPAMRAGDVLFWSAKTIHGSLHTTQPKYSRSSFTAHLIPQSQKFLQLQSRIKTLNLATINGMSVHHPKSQDKLKNKFVFTLETRMPKTFQFAKKVAVKAVTR